MPKPERHILVCMNSRPPGHPKGSCGSAGADQVLFRFQQEFESHGLLGKVAMTATGCLGPCSFAPNVVVYPDAVWYRGVTADDVPEIVKSHLVGGEPVTRLLLPDEVWG